MADGAAVSANEFKKRNLLLTGAATGFLYGFALRLLANLHLAGFEVMTIGFICFMPFALGCVTIYFAEIRERQSIWTWWLLPWLPLAGALAATMITFLEGAICVVMLTPLALVLASFGGLLGGLAGRMIRSRRTRGFTVACVMVLPFFTASWEKPAFYQIQSRLVENVIDIQAPPDVVWRNIERVSAIGREELPKSWTRSIGFPDPVEATLSHEGIGGVRHASFTKGLLFIETIDVWEPEQRLGFTIAADQVPATTLDEHVTIGGPYFDVLRGEYRLEPLGPGVTRLHLSSRHRVSTDFNWYAHLWTDAVMSDLQRRILRVVQRRCGRR
ncbi:MAG TPA: hypothetical protein VE133_07885 [Candidatus Sulfotelmatobacter sp.]|nr:hypothetical protein [Candidatus Sulfotelmatobacter sp.]